MTLSDEQLSKLSEISKEIGIVSLASVAIPSFLDKFEIIPAILGMIATLFFLALSIWLLK